MNRMEKILRPRSIAVIGASRKEGSLGNMFLQAILRMNYRGEIFPVNPKADAIEGIKTYPHVDALPKAVDLAIILLPHPFVPDNMEALGRKGIKNVIVISAGFREVGPEGAEREKQLVQIAQKYGMNVLGPNCMGAFNTDPQFSFNGTFSPTLPKPGHVAYISQSGALGVAILELTAQTDLGFSVFVSTGNKADLSDNDALEFLIHDDNTRVITLYQESIDHPQAFRRICSRLVPHKPVLTVKAGRTGSGLKAASSHTGALANPEHIVDGFLKQCGVIRLDNLEDLFDSARLLSLQPLPAGPRVAVITNAGGPGILASDAIEQAGLTLAELAPATIAQLKSFLPAEAATGNPVDMIASANEETYYHALQAVAGDANVDSILLIVVKPPVNTTPATIIRRLAPLVKKIDKPIVPVVMAQRDDTFGREVFEELNLAVFSYPESAVKALATMWQYRRIKERPTHQAEETPPPAAALSALQPGASGQAALADLQKLLKAYHIPVAPYRISGDLAELLSFRREQTGPFALKAANEAVIHKSDQGLLKLGLKTDEDVERAFNEMAGKLRLILPETEPPLFIIQQQLPGGLELVLGGKRDAAFGAVVMAGVGGIFVEALKDVAFRVAPLSDAEALDMLNDLKAQKLLDGFRGQPGIDRSRFARLLVNFGRLLHHHPEISEMDLNPLVWSAEQNQAVVVDARATIRQAI